MALSPNFKEEYYELLKKCTIIVNESHKYSAVCEKYNSLIKEINRALEDTNSLCVDAERLIDKSTGELKTDAKMVIGSNLKLQEMFDNLSKLFVEKQDFSKYGWTDDLLDKLQVVVAIGNYEKLEKEILEAYGIGEGKKIIYAVKKEILKFEKEQGIPSFFDEMVESLETLFRLRTLFSIDRVVIKPEDNDKIINGDLLLANADGEIFHFKKSMQLCYSGAIYLELSLEEDLRISKLLYYKVVEGNNRQGFVLEENEKIYNKLFDKGEKLIKN